MPDRLSTEILKSRLRDYPRDGYLFIGSIMKGTALAAGTLVLLEILADFSNMWPRLLPWLTSVVAVMVTYLTSGKGILLTNSRANLGDSLFPLLLGIDEFCLFAILLPRLDAPNLWRAWLIVLAVHAFLGFALVYNRLRTMRKHKTELPQSLEHLSNKLYAWASGGKRDAAVGAFTATLAGSLACFVLPRWLAGTSYDLAYNSLTLPFLIILAIVAYKTDQQRQTIDEYVFSDATPQIVGRERREGESQG